MTKQRVDDLRAAAMPFHYVSAHTDHKSISIDDFCVVTGSSEARQDAGEEILQGFLKLGARVQHADQ